MRVEPKLLLRRLTPTSTKMLEAALSRASSGFYEVSAEHLLLALIEDPNGEPARLLGFAGVDRARVMERLERILGGQRHGNPGRPVFAESLFEWVEDAWLVATAERGETRLRSGVLFAQFIAKRARYTGEAIPELDGVAPDSLKRDFSAAVGTSAEDLDATPSSGTGGASPKGGAAPGEGALSRFATCFTQKAREGAIDPIFGRHKEIRQMIDILVRRRKNNPILVGEPGVGKTALVEGLALALVQGDVPESLKGVELWGLDLGLLQAGASVRGEFENRLKSVIEEVKASPKPLVLFIDEAHTLIGAGGQQGGSDAANLLKPALARGELRTIAATTWSEYKKYFEKDAALERRFQPVKVEEPSESDAVVMLRGLKAVYEKAHGLGIRDEAVVAAVQLSSRYLTSRQLPDKAVDLLDTATARVKVALASRPEEVTALEEQVAAITRERDAHKREIAEGHSGHEEPLAQTEEKLRASQDSLATLKTRWEKERDAVHALRAARKAFAEAPAGADTTALKQALDAAAQTVVTLGGEEPLLHAEVDADAVARVVAAWTGIPVGKMKTGAVGAVLGLQQRLEERVRGQPAALRVVADTLQMASAGVRNPDTPLGVLLFVGPSGVGKTETALALADALYGGERFVTTINMSEFQEKHSVSRLIGSPPGYVGYGEGGQLTEAVRQRPYSVVLLDECEKADLEVMNLFYQVFDKGVLNDGEGRTVDFRNTVVILTSNLATDLLAQVSQLETAPTHEQLVEAVRPTLSKHFKPALLARMTIVPYLPVSRDILSEIVRMKLAQVEKRLLANHRMKTAFAPELVEELARRCLEGETGARAVDQLLRGSLLPHLSRELLERFASGKVPGRVSIGLTADKGWKVDFAEA